MKRVKTHEILFFAAALVAACGGSPPRSDIATEQAAAPEHDASIEASSPAESTHEPERDAACRQQCDSYKPCEEFKKRRQPDTPGFDVACAEPFERCLQTCLREEASWQRIEHEGYALSSPGPWETFSEAHELGDGASVLKWGGLTFDSQSGERHTFLCLDWPKALADRFDRSPAGREQTLAALGINAKTTSPQPFSAGPLSGDEIKLDAGDEQGIMRIFWNGDSLCILSAFGRSDIPESALEFFQSFSMPATETD